MKNYLMSKFVKSQTLLNEKGQGMSEYALILSGVAVLVVGVITLLGDETGTIGSAVSGLLTKIAAKINVAL